jgi:hypothetical protein
MGDDDDEHDVLWTSPAGNPLVEPAAAEPAAAEPAAVVRGAAGETGVESPAGGLVAGEPAAERQVAGEPVAAELAVEELAEPSTTSFRLWALADSASR